MDKPIWTVLLIVGTLGGVLGVSASVIGDDDRDDHERYERHEEHERGERESWFRWGEPRPDVIPVRNEDYQAECGACHMAYPPGLLPARSWEAVMNGLDDHFGDNAELMPPLRKELLQYMVDNAADQAPTRRSRAFAGSIAEDAAPLRISETPYFRHEHDELSPRMVSGNDQVRSFSNCTACHRSADKGVFDEHEIVVPGYGRVD